MNKCAKCGYGNREDVLTCNLCGEVLRREGNPDGLAELNTIRTTAERKVGPGKRIVSSTWLRESGPQIVGQTPHGEPTVAPAASECDLWLVGASAAPTPVPVGSTIHIGRDPSNQIVLPAGLVSRRHATVARDGGGKVTVVDLGSQNGTLKNGDKIEGEVAIGAGDKIEVGTFSFQLVEGSPDEADEPQATIRLNRRALSGDGASLRGSLPEVSLTEILESLADSGKTGRLTLVDGVRRGWLFLLEGAPIAAEFAGDSGEAAVRAMVTAETGAFEFKPEAADEVERQIDATLKKILFDAFREIDEKGLPPGADPAV